MTQPFTYTAREYDPETGLYHFRARTYDPKSGRFLQEDPIGFAGGINFYSYVGNNALNYSDPTGLARVEYSGGFHLPAGLIAFGPAWGFNMDITANGLGWIEGNPVGLDGSVGTLFDMGFNVGVADLSNTKGCESGGVITIGMGDYLGLQLTLRNHVDTTRNFFDPRKYLDGIGIGVGIGLGFPVTYSRQDSVGHTNTGEDFKLKPRYQ